MKALALTAALLCSTLLNSPNATFAAPLPATVSWSQPFPGSWNWGPAKTYAANLVEGGYSDWRLPTRAEFKPAIQSAALPALTPGTYFYWTSEKQGTRAWAVTIATDSNGAVIQGQSGATSLVLQSSALHAIGTRL